MSKDNGLDTIDFTVVSSASHGGPPKRTGFFQVTLVDVEHRVTQAGNDRLRFSCSVVSGTEAGSVIFDGFNFPAQGQSSKGLSFFKDFMGSFSIEPKDMWKFILTMALQGGMTIDSLADCISAKDLKKVKAMKVPSKMPKLTGHCKYEMPAPGEKYSKVNWFAPNRWERLAAAEEDTNNSPVPTLDTTPLSDYTDNGGESNPILDEILSI